MNGRGGERETAAKGEGKGERDDKEEGTRKRKVSVKMEEGRKVRG